MSALLERVRMEVTARSPGDLREEMARKRVLAELDRLPRPFDRDSSPIHVTGSALCVGSRGIILHLHKRLGIWLQPGGHLEPGESPWEAALREAAEETGLPVRLRDEALVHIDVHPAPPGHVHLDLRYLVDAADATPQPPPGESPEVRWFGLEEALAIADPGLVGALRALSAR